MYVSFCDAGDFVDGGFAGKDFAPAVFAQVAHTFTDGGLGDSPTVGSLVCQLADFFGGYEKFVQTHPAGKTGVTAGAASGVPVKRRAGGQLIEGEIGGQLFALGLEGFFALSTSRV